MPTATPLFGALTLAAALIFAPPADAAELPAPTAAGSSALVTDYDNFEDKPDSISVTCADGGADFGYQPWTEVDVPAVRDMDVYVDGRDGAQIHWAAGAVILPTSTFLALPTDATGTIDYGGTVHLWDLSLCRARPEPPVVTTPPSSVPPYSEPTTTTGPAPEPAATLPTVAPPVSTTAPTVEAEPTTAPPAVPAAAATLPITGVGGWAWKVVAGFALIAVGWFAIAWQLRLIRRDPNPTTDTQGI